MVRLPRHILILALLALHGVVAAAGPGAHLIGAFVGSAARPDAVVGDSATLQADHPCPVCEFHSLGQLPAVVTTLVHHPVASPLARLVPPATRRPEPTSLARPRAPPAPGLIRSQV